MTQLLIFFPVHLSCQITEMISPDAASLCTTNENFNHGNACRQHTGNMLV